MAYTVERRCFEFLKETLKPEIRLEFIYALGMLLQQYNTTVPSNRFVVGGATEELVTALLRSVGISARAYGGDSKGGDILLSDRKLLSVKGVFTKQFSGVRVTNTMGEGKGTMECATLIVRSGTGIIYVDPDMFTTEDFKRTKDALVLRARAVKRVLKEDPNSLMEIDIPFKPDTVQTFASRGESVALKVVNQLGLEHLPKFMDAG